MYTRRDITNFKTANTALNLLTSYNEFNKFQTLFNNIAKLKHATQQTATIKDTKQGNTALSLLKTTNDIDKFKLAFTDRV